MTRKTFLLSVLALLGIRTTPKIKFHAGTNIPISYKVVTVCDYYSKIVYAGPYIQRDLLSELEGSKKI